MNMKKIYSLLIVAIMTVSATFAQNLGGPYYPSRLDSYDLYYGFRIGYNASSLHFNTDAIDNNSVSAMNFGFITGIPLGNTSLIFEPGVLYSIKGGKLTDRTVRSEVRMHEIEFPVVLKYDIPLADMTDLSVQPFFGGFFGFGLGGQIKRDNMGDRKKLDTYSNRFKRFDAGLRMGCGLAIDFFYLELAYDLGLTNLGNDTKAFSEIYPSYDDWDDKARSGNFSINIGVNF